MEFFTPKEVADLLKVAEYTICQWIRKGDIKATRVGKKFWRIRKSDIDDFLKTQEEKENARSDKSAT